MSDTAKAQMSWLSLSNELWRQIFAHLQQLLLRTSYASITCRTAESRLYTTRLVCRQFNSIFQECTDLYGSLTLLHDEYHPPCPKAVPSLMLWIQQHHAAVHHIRAFCNRDYMEAALAALSTHGSDLVTASLKPVFSSALSLLGAFRGITSCALQGSREGPLSLQALHNLPNLTTLQLSDGLFSEVDAGQHLTRLLISDCQAICESDCRCAASLVAAADGQTEPLSWQRHFSLRMSSEADLH